MSRIMTKCNSVYYQLVSLFCLLASASSAVQLGAEELKLSFASLPERGRAEFVPGKGERKTPQPFRLKQHEFEYQAKESTWCRTP